MGSKHLKRAVYAPKGSLNSKSYYLKNFIFSKIFSIFLQNDAFLKKWKLLWKKRIFFMKKKNFTKNHFWKVGSTNKPKFLKIIFQTFLEKKMVLWKNFTFF